jgi:transcriptional regulator with XRE-family HTH domain
MKRVNRDRVRALRGSETQASLAHRMGVSESTVRNIESGRITLPYGLTLEALAEALGVSAESLTVDDEAVSA